MNLTITNQTCEDIIFNGHYLEKLYFGNDLVWEKQHGPTHDYSQDYFTIESLEDGNVISININENLTTNDLEYISYSSDNGNNWVTTYIDGTSKTISINMDQNDKVLLKGHGTRTSPVDPSIASTLLNYTTIRGSKQHSVYGNIMSLLYADNFSNATTFPTGSIYTFHDLFNGNANLIYANDLVLPINTLVSNCYNNMFSSCTSLVKTPKLSATTLAGCCYEGMFQYCSSLIIPPELPATTLAENCYYAMFSNCTSLIFAPTLPATTLAAWCYARMFSDCTSLTTVPTLPATSLTRRCYSFMFLYCTSLNKVTCLATDISASDCVYRWLDGVSATGTFYKDPTMNGFVVGTNVPSGWTIVDYN